MPRSRERPTLTLRELNRALLARQLLLRRVRKVRFVSGAGLPLTNLALRP